MLHLRCSFNIRLKTTCSIPVSIYIDIYRAMRFKLGLNKRRHLVVHVLKQALFYF